MRITLETISSKFGRLTWRNDWRNSIVSIKTRKQPYWAYDAFRSSYLEQSTLGNTISNLMFVSNVRHLSRVWYNFQGDFTSSQEGAKKLSQFFSHYVTRSSLSSSGGNLRLKNNVVTVRWFTKTRICIKSTERVSRLRWRGYIAHTMTSRGEE